MLGVGARQLRRPIGVNGAEHVVIGEEVVKAQAFGRSPDPPNSGRVSSKLVLRVDGADLHGSSLPRDRRLSYCGRRGRCRNRLGARLGRGQDCRAEGTEYRKFPLGLVICAHYVAFLDESPCAQSRR